MKEIKAASVSDLAAGQHERRWNQVTSMMADLYTLSSVKHSKAMESPTISEKQFVSGLAAEIQWKQLYSLAALYGSIIIGWIAYQNYQPRLLKQFNFTDFTFLLIAAQGAIVVITPMIAGKLGDRYRFEKGDRLPIISSGISFAAMVFMAVAFTLLGNPGEILRWALPVLIICWLIAMSIFTSPALSTMELFTPVDKLPKAMAVLTITGNLVYALEPVIVDIIDLLGAPVTFMLGGFLVFMSGYALKKNSLVLFSVRGSRELGLSQEVARPSSKGFIFFLGLTAGVATTIQFYGLPILLKEKLPGVFAIDGTELVVAMLLFSALVSWPASNMVNKIGTTRSFWISACVVAVSVMAICMVTSMVWILLPLAVFSVAYAFLSVACLPLAISRSAFAEKVFCVGVFFSGVAVPEALWEAWSAF